MKKITTLLFAIVLFSFGAFAQNSDTTRTGGWFGHIVSDMAGTVQIQGTYRYTYFAPLNRILGRDGIPPLSGNDIWINASMNHVHGRCILEDGIGFTPWSTSEANGIKTYFNQYQAFLKFGYNVSQDPRFRLFPFAGVNVSAAVLRIQDNTHIKSTSDFSNEILTSSISKTFYQPNFGIELGGGFDYLIPVKEKTMDCFTVKRSIPIGIRAGYYINAARGDWRIYDYRLQAGPDKNQSAFFVSVNIGLGYSVSK